jgi:hypothetical protein
MKPNAANWDRALRAGAGLALMGCSILAPFPLLTRILAFGASGAYLIGTAIVGSCLGYKLMGKSTCPVSPKEGAR